VVVAAAAAVVVVARPDRAMDNRFSCGGQSALSS